MTKQACSAGLTKASALRSALLIISVTSTYRQQSTSAATLLACNLAREPISTTHSKVTRCRSTLRACVQPTVALSIKGQPAAYSLVAGMHLAAYNIHSFTHLLHMHISNTTHKCGSIVYKSDLVQTETPVFTARKPTENSRSCEKAQRAHQAELHPTLFMPCRRCVGV